MKKVLIAYATRAGSTFEVAQRIGEILREFEHSVDLMNVKEVRSIDNYDFVVIGSAVRMFKLLPETIRFASKFQNSLKNTKTAYFLVCLTVKEKTDENIKRAMEYLNTLIQAKEPIKIGLFAGVMNYEKLSSIFRFMFKRGNGIPEGDFRNWTEIEDWAKELAKDIQ